MSKEQIKSIKKLSKAALGRIFDAEQTLSNREITEALVSEMGVRPEQVFRTFTRTPNRVPIPYAAQFNSKTGLVVKGTLEQLIERLNTSQQIVLFGLGPDEATRAWKIMNTLKRMNDRGEADLEIGAINMLITDGQFLFYPTVIVSHKPIAIRRKGGKAKFNKEK